MDIYEGISEYKEMRNESFKKAMNYIKQYCKTAKDVVNETEYSILEYYYAESMLYNNMGKEAVMEAFKAMRVLCREENYPKELALCYNLIGCNYIHSNPMIALENYVVALELAEKQDMADIIGMMSNNIGCLYMTVHDYKKSLRYLQKAWRTAKADKQPIERQFYFVYNLATCYLNLDDKDKFIKTVRLLEKVYSELKMTMNSSRMDMLFLSLQISYNFFRGNLSFMDHNIRKTLDILKNESVPPDIMNDCVIFTKHWITYGYNDFALEALDYLEKNCIKNGCYTSHKEIIGLRIDIYRQLGKKELLDVEALKYYELSKRTAAENDESLIKSFEARFQIKELSEKQEIARQETRLMKEKSEMDSLTGLYNRYALSELFETKFHQAAEKSELVGVGIIDIDYFKQYNDTYGHLAGDECLKKVAHILTEFTDDDTYFMRYGGDEFVTLCCGKTADEIKSRASAFREKLKKENIEHDGSFATEKVLTVTQGIHIAVPEEQQNFFDFIRMADIALYEGKTDRGKIIYYHERNKMNYTINEKKFEYRTNYREEKALRESLCSLAKKMFGVKFQLWYDEGFWTDAYNPCSMIYEGNVVANISVNFVKFRYRGKVKRYIQLGTVMTDPDFRHLGLSKIIMENILKEYEGKYDCIYLYANDTVLDFYPKFGFEKGTEYTYSSSADKFGSEKFTVRKLDPYDPVDRSILVRKSSGVNPFALISTENNTGLTMFYSLTFMKDMIYYIEEQDTVVLAEYDENELIIKDIYCDGDADFDKIINSLITSDVNRIAFGFTPLDKSRFDEVIRQEEDTTLFILKNSENIFREEHAMFPVMCEA